ncbi:MAG: hypothetical protein JWP95_1234, partial [Actinotalea sp.]|nr:hypothetical protein [Actinotalea sp.]
MPGAAVRTAEIWAAGEGSGASGSGVWLRDGLVLTCRHVLDSALAAPDGRAVIQVRDPASVQPEEWRDATVSWLHPQLDAALLAVAGGPGPHASGPAGPTARLARVGSRPLRCSAVGFPDLATRPGGLRDTEQAAGVLLPAGGARDEDATVPLDVDSSVPSTATLWRGMSGAAVVDDDDRLVGLVIQVESEHGQRRLRVLPLERLADEATFSDPTGAAGPLLIEDVDAAAWRRAVDPRLLGTDGAPIRVEDLTDLGSLGVRQSGSTRQDLAGYVTRDVEGTLVDALEDAVRGAVRVVLVHGPSAAGKSRTLAERVRQDPRLRDRLLLVPRHGDGVDRLLDVPGSRDDAILWLDDLDKHLSAGLSVNSLRRALTEHPRLIALATMRTTQLAARQGELKDPAWEFLTDAGSVRTVRLSATLSEPEAARLRSASSQTDLIDAVGRGVGLGEWLVAGPELMKRLEWAEPEQAAFVRAVVDWYRTGVQQPLPESEAWELWLALLPGPTAARLRSLPESQQREQLAEMVAFATAPVLSRESYEQALVLRSDHGLKPHDFVVDRASRDAGWGPIGEPVWRHAIEELRTRETGDLTREAWWTISA